MSSLSIKNHYDFYYDFYFYFLFCQLSLLFLLINYVSIFFLYLRPITIKKIVIVSTFSSLYNITIDSSLLVIYKMFLSWITS